jgi:WD40 repeat protein
MRRRKRLIAVVCLGLIACVCAGVWLFAPRPVTFRGHTDTVFDVAATPDGRTLASCGRDGTIKLWDVAARKERATLHGHTGKGYWTIVLSPDGKLLASAGDDGGTIQLWDVASGREVAALVGPQAAVYCLAFSPDGKTLASTGSDDTLRLWDAASRTSRSLDDDAGQVVCLAFCCDGEVLATGGRDDGAIELWDVAGGKHRATLRGLGLEIACLAASPDGRTLASADLSGELKLWDAAAGTERFLENPRPNDGPFIIRSMGFSPDGKSLAAVYGANGMEFWDVDSGKNTSSRAGDDTRPRPVPPAPIRALLGIHPKLAEVYAGLTGEETGTAYRVLFTRAGKVFALGRGDFEDDSVVKMWEIHPVPRGK